MFKTDKDAIIPFKSKQSDVGYDLTLIKVFKKINNKTSLYDTGIKIRVNHGLYAEIVPRSSIYKTGYFMANSLGIIDPNYNGNLLVALSKLDDSAPDLELPIRCCQLIFKEQIHMDIIEVSDLKQLGETTRGEGGFGSTG